MPISERDLDDTWSGLRPDAAGLVAAVVQHADDGRVLMLGYMNREAFGATLRSGRVTFWSRSRDELWEKGATSGNTLDLVALRVDCDGDALLVAATPRGPTCHTGTSSCFFQPLDLQTGRPGERDDGPSGVAAATEERGES